MVLYHDPDVVVRADGAAMQMGAAAGLAWVVGRQPRVVFELTITGVKISAVDLVADPERLNQLDLVLLNN